ncbi:hypothetical protein COE55_17875 [Priestia megaterium]|uniref:hypothetical protein n=1 Tax=Priestia megaterium TaxID=1404 RepID=UPI000BFBF329|nr:hypothetical protein [Priestia megaterium]PGZ77306.1 hypothetical protein COE55_17875 [Priestia megaterium]
MMDIAKLMRNLVIGVKVAIVYYQEQDDLITEEVLQNMKGQFNKENWEFFGLFLDKNGEYEGLMDIITNELKRIDVLFLYSKNNIYDEFYWQLLIQSARTENISIKIYLET